MEDLLLIALAGFAASTVDGALGMGFGPTGATILLSAGVSPAATSATVNLAKVVTGAAAGLSHWRFENIDRGLILRLAIPGALGALVGTTILANVDGDSIRPVLAVMLVLVGLRILIRFSRSLSSQPDPGAADAGQRLAPRGVEAAAAAGGVTNGLVGAWGPVVTPFLLGRGVPPRYAVGSVNTAEVVVAIVSAGSLISSLGGAGIEFGVVAAMLTGGVVAAPLAAYVVRFIPARLLGIAVAGLLLTTQTRELASAGLLPVHRGAVYLCIPVALVIAALRPRMTGRFSRRAAHGPASAHRLQGG